jgi:RND family efflux transporter MFP subunit
LQGKGVGAREAAVRRRLARAAIATVAASLAGCHAAEPAAPPRSRSSAAELAIRVATVRARPGALLQRISAPGSLEARRESRIGPEVGGRIVEIRADEGDRVAAGELLFRIDPEPYELALRQALARRDRARAERAQLEADLARGRTLRRHDVLAEQKLEELQTRVAVAAAAEREADEAVSIARRNLERTLVRAPYDASVVARLEDEGTTALVQPQTVVIVLQEVSELEARAAIPEVHLASVRPGDPALLHVEGVPRPLSTEVASVSDAIDPATRTYLVRMRVPNPDHHLKAGVFARVEILPRAQGEAIVVPRDAVRREEGRASVLVVRDGRAVAVPVRIGAVSEDAVEVLHGLRVDEEVIVGGAARELAAGMRVRPADGAGGRAS